MSFSRKAVSIFGSLTLGLLLILLAYFTLKDIEPRSEIQWVRSSDIVKIKYSVTPKSVREILLSTQNRHSLYVNSRWKGFSELYSATKNGVNYSIGFTQEHKLFSDSPELYDMVKVIVVDGVPVLSYENYVTENRCFSGFFLGLGILLVGYALYALRAKLKAND